MASPHASPPPPPPPPAEAESLDEQQHFASILRAFDHYEAWGLAKVERMEADYRALSRAAQEVTRVAAKLDGMRMAISQNACVLDQLLEPHRRTVAGLPDDWRTRVALPQPDGSTRFVPAAHAAYVPESDMEKVQSTIKQMVREWGEEGEVEREAAHAPVLEALCRLLPEPEGRRVLLPGAGLGRLVWDVARLGYTAQGNEFSYFMLLAANFVLNELCRPDDAVVIHPWALQTCNNATTADQLRAARVPHVPPNSLPPSAHMSMCAGDFLEVYRDGFGTWDAVVSLFFIDTAHDVSRYIQRIWDLLCEGGVWINLGPLLWHFHDVHGEASIELSWEELKALIISYGFIIDSEEWRRCAYTTNARSLYHTYYECVFFTARRQQADPASASACA